MLFTCEVDRVHSLPLYSPPRAIIPNARPLSTFENQDDRH